MRILLVDDEPDICSLLTAMLERSGIGTFSAHTLAEARHALESGPYDAIFIDIHLPDGMGYDLIPAIRRKSPGSKVIAISAVEGEGGHAMRAGVDLFLPKPFTRRLVLEKLNGLLPGA